MNSAAASSSAKARTVGQVLADQLVIHGVRHIACVPGESYLPVLDALKDSPIEVIVCRQEGGAAMMAEAWGRASGRPGVCMVTRGPGAANAFVGVHIAEQDANPMILFVGQVERSTRGRNAWQEIDLERAFGGVAKWVVELDEPARVPEILARAFRLAMSGKPGPVVIGLPADVLYQMTEAADAPRAEVAEAGPDAGAMSEIQARLATAQRPIAIVGGTRWDEEGCAALRAFAERFALPVATSYRRGSLFDADHPCYAGDIGLGPNPKLVARIKAADLVLLLGGRLGEIASQKYSLLPTEGPARQLVHVHPDPDELGRLYHPALAVPASARRTALALAELAAPNAVAWAGEAEAAHADYLAWSGTATPQPGAVNFGEILVWLRGALDRDAMICNGAGAYAAWLHRFYRFRRLNAHVAPASATMGYGPPAAIAMKLAWPERQVLSISGDGDFLMNGQEFATMVQYGLPIINLIIDNESYGSIRLSQERAYPGRVMATDLKNPDFAAYARAFGGFGATVERTADFAEAFRAAEASGLPAILHVKVDQECMTPGASLSAIRAEALSRKG
ncbi:thiamine pyrophosphate-binding protein [Phenylobacterium montanum]|uniref:Thiamine pyrophosphate-binding protein n=1 Tax=Phenylobacterium montanum TaxID=2823693 RepID=A0A975FYM7_9CAUL|nr:thiamine pyrophosphate-binding protein [Caulobacter sp. S6]QUD87868.1 thiamine pyrophosphate-binding protein [Caulobacter sp. S6]